jgi:hypothetical protein
MKKSIMKNKLVECLCRATAVMALALAALPALAATQTGNVVREFQCLVVSVDPARHTFRVRHKPTGYETDVVWNEKSRIQVSIPYDIDEIPEGWVECFLRKVDLKKKTISRVDSIRAYPNTIAPPAQADAMKESVRLYCRLLRVPLTDDLRHEANRLLTVKKDAAYMLDFNGERWSLLGLRPRLTRDQDLDAGNLTANLPCLDLSYREEGVVNVLRYVKVAFPKDAHPEETVAVGASGMSAEAVEGAVKRLQDHRTKLAAELKKIMPVTFQVRPELVLKGEPVVLSIEAWAAKQPNPRLILEQSYLQPSMASKKSIDLSWKANEQADGLTRYSAELRLPELPVGQHGVTWTCDVGGDIPEFWRSFAVTDEKTLVTMFHKTNGRTPEDFEQLRVPYDYWDSSLLGWIGGWANEPVNPLSAKSWAEVSKVTRRSGAVPNVFLTGAGYLDARTKAMKKPALFRTEPEPVQRAVLGAIRHLAELSGFQPDDVGVTAYELGTRSVTLAREAGISLIGSLCIHQNWADGGFWTINHTARPLRPYFAASDDFRKAGPGGKDGIVMVSQHDKSILWTEYGVGVFEPCWLDWEWVGGGGGGRTNYDETWMSRHFDLFNAAIQNTCNQKVPYLQSIGIEFTGSNEWSTKGNSLMIRYAVEQAAKGRVVFCHQAAAAEFYRRHYQKTPETLFYDADFWCGIKAYGSIKGNWKPVDYPDLIQIENARYSAFFKKPAALPEYHWDYTNPWDYPGWGNENLPRSAGFLVPGEHDKFSVTPKITDTRKMKVSQSVTEGAGGLEWVITVETATAIRALPLALWDIPREWNAGEGWWKVTGASRFVPIRAPYTGNLNGILEVDAQPGKNEYRLTITTPKRTPQSQDILLKTVHAKVFTRDGQTMAYLWPMQPWETQFELTVPEGKSAQYYAAPKGERVDLQPGKHRLTIVKESWSRIVGLDLETLRSGIKE